jgi:hypothetical protein
MLTTKESVYNSLVKILQTILWTYKFGFVNLYHKLRNRFMFDTPVSKQYKLAILRFQIAYIYRNTPCSVI